MEWSLTFVVVENYDGLQVWSGKKLLGTVQVAYLLMTLSVAVGSAEQVFRCWEPEASYTYDNCSAGGPALVDAGCYYNYLKNQYKPCSRLCYDAVPGSAEEEECSFLQGCKSEYLISVTTNGLLWQYIMLLFQHKKLQNTKNMQIFIH